MFKTNIWKTMIEREASKIPTKKEALNRILMYKMLFYMTLFWTLVYQLVL